MVNYSLGLAPYNVRQGRVLVRQINRQKDILGEDLIWYFHLLEFPNKIQKLETLPVNNVSGVSRQLSEPWGPSQEIAP